MSCLVVTWYPSAKTNINIQIKMHIRCKVSVSEAVQSVCLWWLEVQYDRKHRVAKLGCKLGFLKSKKKKIIIRIIN